MLDRIGINSCNIGTHRLGSFIAEPHVPAVYRGKVEENDGFIGEGAR